MRIKIGVKQIVDSCKSKDDVTFYKLQWHETWLHESHVENWQDLINQYWGSHQSKDKSGKSTDNGGITTPDNTKGVSCVFCEAKGISETDQTAHEKDHISTQTSTEVLQLLKKTSEDSSNKSIMLLCPSSSTTTVDYDDTFGATTSKTHTTSTDDDERLFHDTVGDVLMKKSNVGRGSSHTYICPKCNQEFSSFSQFRMHYHVHQSELAHSVHFCRTCNKSFTSNTALGKHTKLHRHMEHAHYYKVIRKHQHSGQQRRKTRKKTRPDATVAWNNWAASGYTAQKHLNTTDSDSSQHFSDLPAITKENNAAGVVVLQPAVCVPFTQVVDPSSSSQQQAFFSKAPDLTTCKLPDSSSFRSREPEFTPDVLKSARQYIKAVSQRRKEYTMKRMNLSSKDPSDAPSAPIRPEKHSVCGIGVDVELKRSEESLPIISKQDDGRFTYACKICGKAFFNKFHHREHFNVHSGEMPYECEFCSKRFAQRSGWNRHIKLHHKYEIFQGPIPYSHNDKKRGKWNRKEERFLLPKTTTTLQVAATPQIGSPNVAAIPIDAVVNRYISIAPYPAPVSSIPVTPTMLSPDRFPGGNVGTTSINGMLLHPVTMMATPVAEVSQASTADCSPNLPKIVSVTSGANPSITSAVTGKDTEVIFQCKKVRTMVGHLIFMVRIAPASAHKLEERDRKPEFAYVLDNCGDVKSKIFVNDDTGEGWVDFPLDPLANEVLLERLRYFGDKSRPGPKPKPRLLSATDQEGGGGVTAAGLVNLEMAFAKFQQRYQEFLVSSRQNATTGNLNISGTNMMQKPSNSTIPPPSTPPPSTPPPLPPTTITNVEMTDIGTVNNPIVAIEQSVEEAIPTSNDYKQQHQQQRQQQQQQKPIPKESHGRRCTSGKVKRFSCSTCGRKFLAQAHLNDHMLIHTGEFPYKCMFCSRPFRHKSGLNSHHKRHIQNGVFDRPISAYKARGIQKENDENTEQMDDDTQQSIDSTTTKPTGRTSQNEKSKRKRRTPQHVEPRVAMDADILLHIKEEVNDDEDIDIGACALNENVTNEQIAFDTRDVFECNFCGMNFPLRTAYLKHVNTVHKAPNNANRHSLLDDTSTLAPSTGTNLGSDYIGIDDFSDSLLDCDSVHSSPDDDDDNVTTALEEGNSQYTSFEKGDMYIPNVKIKQEVIDE